MTKPWCVLILVLATSAWGHVDSKEFSMHFEGTYYMCRECSSGEFQDEDDAVPCCPWSTTTTTLRMDRVHVHFDDGYSMSVPCQWDSSHWPDYYRCNLRKRSTTSTTTSTTTTTWPDGDCLCCDAEGDGVCHSCACSPTTSTTVWAHEAHGFHIKTGWLKLIEEHLHYLRDRKEESTQ